MAVARRSVAVTLAGLTLGIGLLLDRAAGTCPATHAVLSLLGAPVVPICMGCATFLIGQGGCTSNQQFCWCSVKATEDQHIYSLPIACTQVIGR